MRVNTGKHAFDLIVPVGLILLCRRLTLELISPYHPALALNRVKLSERSHPHRILPIRYIVGRASHPIISAMVACRPRGQMGIHLVLSSTDKSFLFQHIKLHNIVSQITSKSAIASASRASTGDSLDWYVIFYFYILNYNHIHIFSIHNSIEDV